MTLIIRTLDATVSYVANRLKKASNINEKVTSDSRISFLGTNCQSISDITTRGIRI